MNEHDRAPGVTTPPSVQRLGRGKTPRPPPSS